MATKEQLLKTTYFLDRQLKQSRQNLKLLKQRFTQDTAKRAIDEDMMQIKLIEITIVDLQKQIRALSVLSE